MLDLYPSHHPPPGGLRSLTETLLLTTTAATTRTNEATLMFGGVASAIDEAARGANSPVLPPHLRGIYEEFLSRLHAVAQSFFESHVRGSTVNGQNRRPPTQSTQQNTYNARQLLGAVYEAQRVAADRGGRTQGDVEWMTVIKDRKMALVNCGL